MNCCLKGLERIFHRIGERKVITFEKKNTETATKIKKKQEDFCK